MKSQYEAIPQVVNIIKEKLHPLKIILFGSCARRCITRNSDIDICIVLKQNPDIKQRAKMRAELLSNILEVTDYEVDLLICGQQTWEARRTDQSTIEGKIQQEGVVLYG